MKIKILHLLVSNTYNGAENVVCQISNLFEDDSNTEIIYCSPDGSIRSALEEQRVKFEPLANLSVKEIRRIISIVNPTIIHAHDMRANVLAYLANRSIPRIAHVHNNNFDSRGISLKSVLFYIAAKNARHIFWVSKTSFEGYYFAKKLNQKSEVLYNVINIEALYDKASRDTAMYDYDFVYLGRLTYQKNPERLVRLMHKLVDANPKIKCAILGDGELAGPIREYISIHNLENNIHYLGFSSNPYKILQCSKAMIMTSRWEGLPMCALEAFSLGIPVISTPADGLKEIIVNNRNGFISDEDDELKVELLRIFEDNNYQSLLSQNALDTANELMDLEKYKKSISIAYLSCIKK